ncbi:MAG: LPS-assembly protein LptD [Firmicutes bacterium]|nr:LPS-assembly protein LptD [Bacillota bacterium]
MSIQKLCLVLACLTLMFAFSASTLVAADSDERVVVRAEGLIQILAGGKEIIAQDGVQIHYRDMVIYSDWLHYATEENLALFSGHVQIEQGGQYVQSENLEYDFKHQKAKIGEAKAVVVGEGLKGDIYVRGETIETEADAIFIHGGKVTTCDLDHPHFYLQAGELEIYPDDKMVIRRVSYWEGRIPLFYWPYLVIPLGRESSLELPQIGYSPSEGWFIKTAYNYYRGPESYGKLHLDYMQKKGFGTGVDHTYYDRGSAGKGQVSIYRLHNPQSDITTWEGDWSHSWQLNPEVKVELGTEYWLQPAVGQAEDKWELEPSIKLAKNGKTETYTLKGEHRRIQANQFSTETELDWKYRRRLSDTWQLSSSGHFLGMGPEDSTGSYVLYDHNLLRTTANNQLSLRLEQDVHPALRGKRYTSFTWETLQRMPEITWQSRGWSLLDGRLPAYLKVGAGHYRETYPKELGLEGNKLSLEGGIATRRFNLGPKAYVTYDGSIELDAYKSLVSYQDTDNGRLVLDTPEADMSRVVITSYPRLVVRPLDPLTLDFSYKDQWVIGSSPFLFDELKNSETLSGRVSWRTPTFGASIGTGYDFWSGTFNNLAGQVHLRPDERYELNVWASYDLEDDTWQSARGMISLMPWDNLFLRAGTSYSFTHEKWDSLDGQVQITLPHRWRFEYVAGYSGVKEEWTKSSAMLALDLHCRELRFRYDQLNGTAWVEYSINALPQTRLTMGAGDQLDVKVDGLADLISQVSQSAGGN